MRGIWHLVLLLAIKLNWYYVSPIMGLLVATLTDGITPTRLMMRGRIHQLVMPSFVHGAEN
jgi:hypothetical protein